MIGPPPAEDAPDPMESAFGLDDLVDDLCDVRADTPDPVNDVAGRAELPTFDEFVEDVPDPRPRHQPTPLHKKR
jgi:hypothetical protein